MTSLSRWSVALGAALCLSACHSPQTKNDPPAGPGSEEASPAGVPRMATSSPLPSRRFRVRYQVDLEGLKPGKQVRLWIPLPTDDPHQKISEVSVKAPWQEARTRESAWGNTMLFFEGEAEAAKAQVVVNYTVLRHENRANPARLQGPGRSSASLFAKSLRASSLVKVNAKIRGEAAKLSAGRQGTLAVARAFYDHVQKQMAYDKSGEGWGQGDSAYACSVGKGNCTDYHAYFMALCLAAKIPARFQIGLYGPYALKPGKSVQTGGYHCWAEFHVPGGGWVPVDISEGDKHPERGDYFFGAHTPNRVTLSTGRDLVLSPPQRGAPLNYFVNPYAELEGKAVSARKSVRWTELSAR